MGNYLISKKLFQGKLFLLCSPKEGGMENVAIRNVTVKKQSNLIIQDEVINMERDEVNEIGKFSWTI